MIQLVAIWKAITSRPAFFLFGILAASLGSLWMSSIFSQEATSSVSPSRQTRRVRSAPLVEIHPEVVKAPALKKRDAKKIEKEYGLGEGTVTTAEDIARGELSENTVTDEQETTTTIPEGAKVKAASILKEDGSTTVKIVTKLPLFSGNQRFGFGIGLRETISDIQSTPNIELSAKARDGFYGYGFWEPLHFPRWRSHIRLTVDPQEWNSLDEVTYSLALEYRGD